ncbi:MAG: DNA mismatch repair protein MutS [Bacteroidetes bacterium]|nr:DNA mismatch repair protein MutS [Bacteroidota bacterium]
MIKNRTRKKKDDLLRTFGKIKDDPFDFGQIEAYFLKKDQSSAFQVLSDKTCNDLDFNELFAFIDRTTSKIGQQYLYNKLRTLSSDATENNRHEKLIKQLSDDQDSRVNIQYLLSKLNSTEAYYISSLFQDEHLKPPKWFFIVRVLSLTSLLSLILTVFYPVFFLVLLANFIVNLVLHYWNKRNVYEYLVSLPQLLKLNGIARELLKYSSLKDLNPGLSALLSVLDKIRNRMSYFNLEAKLQGDIQIIFWTILELIKILFLLEPMLLFGVLRQLDTKRKEIGDVFMFVGEVDSFISIASLRKGLDNYCLPVMVDTPKTIAAREVYHPLIKNCVKNSIYVDGKSILLTGSNMSGKTSFIRTIGVNVITGLTLNTCFAEQFSMPFIRVFSAIRISDDLVNDRSYYFEEVLTIKEMIDKCVEEPRNLFLLDEIFKGTNTVERISAGKAVLSSLAKSGNIVFVSTHDIELADLLTDDYELYHFSEKVDQQTVDFDYRIKHGKLKNRNAIRILQINGYPGDIIEEAIAISAEMDKIKVIPTP